VSVVPSPEPPPLPLLLLLESSPEHATRPARSTDTAKTPEIRLRTRLPMLKLPIFRIHFLDRVQACHPTRLGPRSYIPHFVGFAVADFTHVRLDRAAY
jgi:hypothetical protein